MQRGFQRHVRDIRDFAVTYEDFWATGVWALAGMGRSVSEVKGALLDWASYPEVGTSKERKRKRGYDLGAGEEATWKRPIRVRLS